LREGERDGATSSGGISSESETDGQKYRHGNKERKWRSEGESGRGAESLRNSFVYVYVITRGEGIQ